MDKMIYGLDLPNEVAVRNMEILTKELNITDDEINALDEYKNELQKYCLENHLVYARLMSAVKGFGDNEMSFYATSGNNNGRGLNNETPAHIILVVRKNENKIEIKQTEYTKQYLSTEN